MFQPCLKLVISQRQFIKDSQLQKYHYQCFLVRLMAPLFPEQLRHQPCKMTPSRISFIFTLAIIFTSHSLHSTKLNGLKRRYLDSVKDDIKLKINNIWQKSYLSVHLINIYHFLLCSLLYYHKTVLGTFQRRTSIFENLLTDGTTLQINQFTRKLL